MNQAELIVNLLTDMSEWGYGWRDTSWGEILAQVIERWCRVLKRFLAEDDRTDDDEMQAVGRRAIEAIGRRAIEDWIAAVEGAP